MKRCRMPIYLPVAVLIILASLVLVPRSAFAVPVNSGNGTMIVGAEFTNDIVVDGGITTAFLVKSATQVQMVVLSYVDQGGTPRESDMSLVGGSPSFGWWQTTVPAKVDEVKSDSSTNYQLEPMTVSISNSGGTVKLAVSQGLMPTWSIQQQTTTQTQTRADSNYLLLLAVLGGVTVVGGSGAVLLAGHRRRLDSAIPPGRVSCDS